MPRMNILNKSEQELFYNVELANRFTRTIAVETPTSENFSIISAKIVSVKNHDDKQLKEALLGIVEKVALYS